MNATPRTIGRVTVALGLVAAGAALLLDNLLQAGPRYSRLLLQLWPVFLIGLGIECLIVGLLDRLGQHRPLRFDVGGAFLLAGALALTSVASALHGLSPDEIVPNSDEATTTDVRTVPAAGATALTVDIDVGHVTLLPHPANEVRVEVQQAGRGLFDRRDGAAPRVQLTAEGGETVRVVARSLVRGFHLGVWQTAYRIYVPADLAVTVRADAGTITVREYEGDLNLATDAGSITVTDAAGSLVAETDSGSIQVTRFAGPVDATTSAGAIAATAVDGALTLHSGTGIITVTEHGGADLAAETSTGTISAEFAAVPRGPITLRTATGAIRLNMPAESDATIRAATQSGSISGMGPTEGRGASRSATATLGAGTYPVTLEANTGSISVNLR